MIGLDDTFPFGQHKMKVVRSVLGADPSYGCWLRQSRKDAGQSGMFKKDVHDFLDNAIANSRTLQKKFKSWNVEKVNMEEVIKGNVAKLAVIDEVDARRMLAYVGEWGSW
jgi:hypothetical protein